MSQQTVRHLGLHGAIVVLLLITAAMTTFFATQNIGADAAGIKTKSSKTTGSKTTSGKAAANPSFVVTVPHGDAYKFTDNTPGSYSGGTVNLGNWTVQDTTTHTNLGTISGTIQASNGSNNNVGETSSFTAPILGKVNNSITSYPSTMANVAQSAPYLADVANGETLTSASVSPMGPYLDIMGKGTTTDDLIDTATNVLDFGPSSNTDSQLIQTGMTAQNGGYNEAFDITASTPPTQSLAMNYGGGPRAVLLPNRPAIAPLAIFFVGIAISVVGLGVQSACSFKSPSHPCSPTVKGITAVIGGLMAIAGGLISGYSGAVYNGARAATAAAGQLATGFAETQMAVTEGTAVTAAGIAELQQQMSALTAAVTITAA